MPTPLSIVAKVTRLDAPDEPLSLVPPASNGMRVDLEGEETVVLDAKDPRAANFAEVLADLRDLGLPAYVEVSANRRVTELRVPLIVRVRSIEQEEPGVFAVELEPSYLRHVLRASTPHFAELLDTLLSARDEGAVVAVTETPGVHEIVDVRLEPTVAPLDPPTESPLLVSAAAPPAMDVISPARAKELFAMARQGSCNPAKPYAPCIPFLYPDDGCWARAHEMCRLMRAQGVVAGKVWIYGRLDVTTSNHPECRVPWICHVAPIVNVKARSTTKPRVIDPSLFRTPVSIDRWKRVQGDRTARLVHTDASVFDRTARGGIKRDPTFHYTRRVLAYYRTRLKRRSARSTPPPYSHCRLPPRASSMSVSVSAP